MLVPLSKLMSYLFAALLRLIIIFRKIETHE